MSLEDALLRPSAIEQKQAMNNGIESMYKKSDSVNNLPKHGVIANK